MRVGAADLQTAPLALIAHRDCASIEKAAAK
jgi:hypothetical protein